MDIDIEIPAFLRRSGSKSLPKFNPVPKLRTKRYRPKTDKVEVHLADEIPRVGSGYRTVEVETIGRKWITLLYLGERVRVRRAVWDRIRKVGG